MVSQIEEKFDSSANSMDDILRQLDQDEIRIVISKDIRRFRKIATVVKGLKDRRDTELLTKELKTKIGTGGTYKDGQIVLQGDHREYVKNLLLRKGYNDKSIEVM
ncbi:MAG: stress response translation initiation inhibitor YciH [Nitrososphaeraceae archaeon]|nr:stress response translation initiation inhibitor YciH [Nitrososphaeraceae archaeon]MBV9668251.1 stress response translation initiation inhibitor YciH [Nitrososphaeraceae archaeon]